ncbi:hypothetical protein TNCV_1188731 [Trichonephila clavipes]|nr:hypothetical protein TNCV_1188731 [Trichonephila clavipes]
MPQNRTGRRFNEWFETHLSPYMMFNVPGQHQWKHLSVAKPYVQASCGIAPKLAAELLQALRSILTRLLGQSDNHRPKNYTHIGIIRQSAAREVFRSVSWLA